MGKWMGIVLVTVLAGCSGTAKDAEQRITSLTIYPVTAGGQQHDNVAEALGLLLEKEGFASIEIAGETFRPADADFEKTVADFGKHVGGTPIQTEYALYCEFEGSPTTGVQAVREVVVDRQGRVLWSEVQTPEDRAFKRIKPNDLMSCCVLVSERLEPMLVKSDSSTGRGKMEQLWARKSGTPEPAEFERMKNRLEGLRKTGRNATFTVYPVRVGDRVDRQKAKELSSMLATKNLCEAQVAETPIQFDVAASSNQQKMLWDMAHAFRKAVREQPLESDYALFADYVLVPGSGQVWAVHFAVVDRSGEFVIVDFQNDHHEDFQAVAPESLEDCNRLAAHRFAGYLK